MIEYLIYLIIMYFTSLLFLFCFISSFQWHELFHIKCDDFNDVGDIQVFKKGFSACRTNKDNTPWFFFGGGILSGVCFILAAIIIYFLPVIYVVWCFFTAGLVNLVYGFFEGIMLPRWGNNKKYTVCRYSLYLIIVTIMVIILFWMVKV